MKIEEIRSEFRIIFYDENYLNSTELYQSIADAGYDTQFYPTFDSALLAIRSGAPHILVMQYSKNEWASDRFLNHVRKISPETLIILMINETHAMSSIMKTAVGEIFDYLTVPLISSAELLIQLDRATGQLYLKYENEQLRKRRSAISEPALGDLSFEEGDVGNAIQKLEVQFQDLVVIKDQEELVKKYIFQLASCCGSMPVLYLKYLPLQSSFVHSQSIWTPLADVKNLGFKVESTDQIKTSLQEFMEQVFQINQFGTFVHRENNHVKGLTVVFNKENPAEKFPGANLLHHFFESVFARNSLIRELHNEQSNDSLSGLLNKRSFEDQLNNEISRARRIETPVSLMKIQIDNYDLLGQKYGEENICLVVKAFAKSMKKNFRNIDILSRTAKNEFCFLLPHTDIRNTLVKAEKIRRAFNGSTFPFLKIEDRSKLSLSIGVSEYPALSSDAETLMKSCDEALYQVLRNNGNRVAAWQANAGFKPDFRSRNVE